MTTSSNRLATNFAHRPYDRFLHPKAAEKARKLRINPDGVAHPVLRKTVAGVVTNVYPWDRMELGDFFFAPIGDRSPSSMRVSFCKAAVRYDYEISVIRMLDPRKVDCLRVTVSAIGVHSAKLKAYWEGYSKHMPATREQQLKKRAALQRKRREIVGTGVRRDRSLEAKLRAAELRVEKLREELHAKDHQIIKGSKHSDPFWRDSRDSAKNVDPVNPFDVHPSAQEQPVGDGIYTDSTMTREEKVRLALSRNA